MPGVYISYPFCSQKCTFCNFASGVFAQDLEERYGRALRREVLNHQWDWTPETIYFGGGTPSRIDNALLSEVLRAIPGAPFKEVTLEAAPGTFTRAQIKSWVRAGVNRVSLGVQSFVKQELSRTGRKHDADIVAADVRILRECGIENLNIDLIAGLPYQSRASWEQSLAWIEKLAPPHVSVYLLEVDEDSRLGLEILDNGSRYGAGTVPDADTMASLYEIALERLAQQGIQRYEISNFAAPGMESAHNLKYWRLEPYVGFGSDAHSFDGVHRWGNLEAAGEYADAIEAGRSVRTEESIANTAEERFFVGLRLQEGIRLDLAERQAHASTIDRFVRAGLLEEAHGRLRFSDRGVLLSNDVLQEFIAG